MKSKENSSSQLSRRKFLGTAAIAATGTLLPSIVSYGSNPKLLNGIANLSNPIPNSKFAGRIINRKS